MDGVRVTRCLEEEAATHFSHVVTVTVTAAVHCKHSYVTLAAAACVCGDNLLGAIRLKI